jgi:16S rRNA (cytosine967-C5)-methyltransferase
MKKQKPRDLALQALNRLSRRAALSDRILDDLFRSAPDLDDRDRAFISHLFLGVLRWRLRLDWIIEQNLDFPLRKIDSSVLNILRLAVYQVLFMSRVPESAAVDEAVKQVKFKQPRHVVSFVNGILRTICRGKDAALFPDPKKDRVLYLSRFHSYPEWLVLKWIREQGMEATENLLAAGNQIPGLVLRTNQLKVSRPELQERLKEEGILGSPTPFSPQGLRIEDLRGRVDELPSFRDGLFQVQDEAAQLASFLLAPQSGETVLDVCAGFGGKSTHLAELMKDRGRVIALDRDARRLLSLEINRIRLGIRNLFPLTADATQDISSLFRTRFDAILVDAPCSGLGVLSRHPDAKWNKSEADLSRLADLQQTIIRRAIPLLRKGGKLLYVVCTISKEENEEVVRQSLESHREIVLCDLRERAPEWAQPLIDREGFFRTFPHKHGMDGFFAALFRKK